VAEVIRRANDLGLPQQMRLDLKGLLKVIKRGGAMGLLGEVLFPEGVDASDCPFGPGTCIPNNNPYRPPGQPPAPGDPGRRGDPRRPPGPQTWPWDLPSCITPGRK
jgi:hypothetical protein